MCLKRLSFWVCYASLPTTPLWGFSSNSCNISCHPSPPNEELIWLSRRKNHKSVSTEKQIVKTSWRSQGFLFSSFWHLANTIPKSHRHNDERGMTRQEIISNSRVLLTAGPKVRQHPAEQPISCFIIPLSYIAFKPKFEQLSKVRRKLHSARSVRRMCYRTWKQSCKSP